MGGLSLFWIDRLLPIQKIGGDDPIVGIHLSPEWWLIWKIFLMFVISYLMLITLLRSWYPRSQFDRQQSSYLSVPLYLSSLIFPALIAGSQPIGVFVFAIIALNVFVKANEPA
jgi:hypothetical protein